MQLGLFGKRQNRHLDWGKLGLKRVLAPAITAFENGVPVAPRVAQDWFHTVAHLDGHARNLFLNDGAAPKAGSVFRHKGQAELLRRIAKDGRKGFYEGEAAEDMVAALREAGGCRASTATSRLSSTRRTDKARRPSCFSTS